MAIPAPEPGLVISYAYLWDREAQDGLGPVEIHRELMSVDAR